MSSGMAQSIDPVRRRERSDRVRVGRARAAVRAAGRGAGAAR